VRKEGGRSAESNWQANQWETTNPPIWGGSQAMPGWVVGENVSCHGGKTKARGYEGKKVGDARERLFHRKKRGGKFSKKKRSHPKRGSPASGFPTRGYPERNPQKKKKKGGTKMGRAKPAWPLFQSSEGETGKRVPRAWRGSEAGNPNKTPRPVRREEDREAGFGSLKKGSQTQASRKRGTCHTGLKMGKGRNGKLNNLRTKKSSS